MQVAREFNHERTKQCIAHLNVIALSPAQKTPPRLCQRDPLGDEARPGERIDCSCRSSLEICGSPSPPSCTTRKALTRSNMTPPGRMLKWMRAMPQVCWMPKLNASMGEENGCLSVLAFAWCELIDATEGNRALQRERNRAH